MSRIVGFLGARPGVGSTTICFELAKKLAMRGYRVCLIDFYFSMNDISLKIKDDYKFDLKDYLLGKIGLDGIIEEIDGLFFIKSNDPKFDYLKYELDIEEMVDNLVFKFDYIFIDINSFDFKILTISTRIVSEVYLVFDNEPNSIRIATRMFKYFKKNGKAENINFIFNKSKIIGQLKRKYLSRNEIEDIINKDIIFEIPKFFKYNNKTNEYRDKIMERFCNSFITNKVLHYRYEKKYKGLFGKVRKFLYAKFE